MPSPTAVPEPIADTTIAAAPTGSQSDPQAERLAGLVTRHQTVAAALREQMKGVIRGAAHAHGWTGVRWEGEFEYMDDGGCAFCINRIWITMADGGDRSLPTYSDGDWDFAIDQQITDSPDAEQGAIDAACDELRFPEYQAATLGVSLAFLNAVVDAVAIFAYASEADGEVDLTPEPSPALEKQA